jgi:hypothetical protein
MNWLICGCSRGRRPRPLGVCHDEPAAVGDRGYSLNLSDNAKMLLQVSCGCPIGSAAIWDGDEIVYLAGRSLVLFASGMRIRRQQRCESFALRHDAAGFRRDET